jgi:hypothetical protein
MKKLTLLLLLALAVGAGASKDTTDITFVPCSTTIANAHDKDTIYIRYGKAVWKNGNYISNKGLYVFGISDANGNKPDILDSGVYLFHKAPFYFAARATDTIRVSNLRFTGMSKHTEGTITITGSKAFRIDHCSFYDSLNQSRSYKGGLGSEGVIDNDSFVARHEFSWQAITPFGENATTWAEPEAFGTGHNVFIEDCAFLFSYDNDGAIDAEGGGKFVCRYCVIDGTSVANHGFDSGGLRGNPYTEIYNNIFTNPHANLVLSGMLRSGTAVIYNNTITGTYQFWFVFRNYRSDPEFNGSHTGPVGTTLIDTVNRFVGGDTGTANFVYKYETNESDTVTWYHDDSLISKGHITWHPGDKWATTYYYQSCGLCLGFSPCDSNRIVSDSGYPCMDQIGRGVNQSLSPVYAWNNVFNGDSTPSFTVGYSTREKLQIRVNRDFYENTPKPGYVAYTYPHPLRTLMDGTQSTPSTPKKKVIARIGRK